MRSPDWINLASSMLYTTLSVRSRNLTNIWDSEKGLKSISKALRLREPPCESLSTNVENMEW